MAGTLRALKRFQKAVQEHGVDRIRVVATSAMRDARNANAFQAWVKAETGWNLEIISGLEEGRLIHLGVTAGEPGAAGRVLLVDLGGGSCEITLSERKRIKETISLPLGAVRLTGEFLTSDPASPEDLARMRHFIARELRRAQRKIQPGEVPLVIGTSGTAAALSDAAAAAGKTAASSKKSGKGSSGKNCRKSFPVAAGKSDCVRVPCRDCAHDRSAEARSISSQDDPGRERSCAGHRAAAGGDHRGRRVRLRRVAGELRPRRFSLFPARPARWDSGPDAGRTRRTRPPFIGSLSMSGG